MLLDNSNINFVVIIATLVGLIIFSLFSPENASALKPVAEITSVTTYNGEPVKEGAIIRAASGAFTGALSFQYRGFDDNDHIIELRCSWDGINYLKSSCPQGADEQEYRQSFEGPDGVIRDYYYKSQSFTRAFQLTPTLVSYIFGVKVLNDNNELSPAATFTFKLVRSSNVGSEQTAPASKPYKSQVMVQLNSITVHNDHDASVKGKGEFNNHVYVQGHHRSLNMEVDSGETRNFWPTKQITTILPQGMPLSIFTIGIEEDSCDLFGVSLELPPPPEYLAELEQTFSNPSADWYDAISKVKTKIKNENLIYPNCSWNTLGTINEIYKPPSYESGKHEIKSSNGDYTLRYTIIVTPVE
jgi:hypothetical protein